MKKIYKYTLSSSTNIIELPRGYGILDVGSQQNIPAFWAEIDPEQDEMQTVVVYVFGTGVELPENIGELHYIGTSDCGMFIWHIYVEGLL